MDPWNRVRDVWHADPRIKVSADELDQLRKLVRDRKGSGGVLPGFMERVAAIEAELRGRTEALAPQRVMGGFGQWPKRR
jgi:hypothetical protein